MSKRSALPEHGADAGVLANPATPSEPLPHLPPEMWMNIFLFFKTIKGLLSLRLVSRQWRDMIDHVIRHRMRGPWKEQLRIYIQGCTKSSLDMKMWPSVDIFQPVAREAHNIHLQGTRLGDEGAVMVAKALEHNKTLGWLLLSRNNIGKEGLIALSQPLKYNRTTVSTLFLDHNSIGNEGAITIAQALKHNTTLFQLCLNHNGIGDEGAVAIAQALKSCRNTRLEALHLDHNCIGNKGANAIASSIGRTKLDRLYLSYNEIGYEGAFGLAYTIGSTCLTRLDLTHNKIGFKGAAMFAQAMAKMTTKEIELWI